MKQQHNEYRDFVTNNEKGDLTKKRMIEKFSDQNGKLSSHDIQEKRAPDV